jgi:hypothetical protein
MDTPGDPFSGKLRAVNSNPHAPVADPAPATVPATAVPTAAAVSVPVIGEGATTPRREVGGRDGLEPTRYGDWELRGRCIDF